MATSSELFELAVRYQQNGNPQHAEALCRQILQAEPMHHAAYHLLGLLAHQAGHNNAAITLISQAVALNPHEAAYHFHLGIVLMSQGQAAEAIEAYRRALRISPDLGYCPSFALLF